MKNIFLILFSACLISCSQHFYIKPDSNIENLRIGVIYTDNIDSLIRQKLNAEANATMQEWNSEVHLFKISIADTSESDLKLMVDSIYFPPCCFGR